MAFFLESQFPSFLRTCDHQELPLGLEKSFTPGSFANSRTDSPCTLGSGHYTCHLPKHTTENLVLSLRANHEASSPVRASASAAPSKSCASIAQEAIGAKIKYGDRTTENLWLKLEDGSTNLKLSEFSVEIQSARPLVAQLSIDDQGFEMHHLHSKMTDWEDNEAVVAVYYPEVMELVMRVTGAKHVHVMAFARRTADRSRVGGIFTPLTSSGYQGPLTYSHNDYTEISARRRIEYLFGRTAATLAGRFAIMNLWKPIVDVVVDEPLGFLDNKSVPESDMSPCRLLFPDIEGEARVVHAPAEPAVHRWFFFPQQRRHEAVLFKQYDSDPSRAQWSPHVSFKDPACPPAGTFSPRRSIEMRLIVFFDIDGGELAELQAMDGK